MYEAICALWLTGVQRICWVTLWKSVLQRYLSIRAIKLCDKTKKGALETPSVSFEIVISDLRRRWLIRKGCWILITGWSSLDYVLNVLPFSFFLPPQQVRGNSILEYITTVANLTLEQVPGTGMKLSFVFYFFLCCVCAAELLILDVLSLLLCQLHFHNY